MRIFGIGELASSSLVQVLESGHDSVLILCHPQSCGGSRGTLNSMLLSCVQPLQEPQGLFRI